MVKLLWLVAMPLMLIGCVPENRSNVTHSSYDQPSAFDQARYVCASYGYPPGTASFAYCVERTIAVIQHAEYCRRAASGFGDINSAMQQVIIGQGRVDFGTAMTRVERARGC